VSVLLITYSLNNQLKDYTPFVAAIKNNCDFWWHYFNTTWIVSTQQYSADAYAKLLYPLMETTDRLLVVRLTAEQQGWLPKEAWDWLNDKHY
jgi:hypothetical protein